MFTTPAKLPVKIATELSAWISNTAQRKGPLTNVSDLVGRWVKSVTIPGASAPHNIDGSQSYDGFSGNLGSIFSSYYADDQTKLSMVNIGRFRESTIRALANVGTARIWNLMIDVIAQTGRYPANASSLANFTVEGEQRYWVHVAIDRFTGEVIDRRVESVRE